ncbi:hypothetical protein [Kitasatospora fiedleri]|uniref:hypothetical protein n=1 Tax=Kitasatospora fiedleri TaxID=2991545 RepID=UPI00249A3E9E|nr:hypothetical protein [Kitasatospora fiedleri]
MYRSPTPPAGVPRALSADELLHAFGEPVAHLADPPAHWRVNHDCQRFDDHLTDIEVQYIHGTEHQVVVRTTRPAPRGGILAPDILLAGFFRTYLANYSDTPDPEALTATVPGPETVLHLDGAEITAATLTAPGHHAFAARNGERAILVAASTRHAVTAHHLRLVTR